MELLEALLLAHLAARLPHISRQMPVDTEALKGMAQRTDRTIYQAPHPSGRDFRKDIKPFENGAGPRRQYSLDAIARAAQTAPRHVKTDALDRPSSHAVLPPPKHRGNARDPVVERDKVL